MEFAGGRLLTDAEGPIGWLTINQPERLNAVRYDMWRAFPEAMADLQGRDGVRVIVVRGAGEKAFASGADIAEFETERFDATSNHRFTEAVSAATGSLVKSSLPAIAMIRGYCIGGGMVIASACDIRVGTPDAQFAVPAGKLGLGYELDYFKRLAGIVGPGLAMEFLATARRFTAQEALAAGFLNRIVAAAELDAVIRDYAAMIASTAPLSIAAAKSAGRAVADPALNVEAQAAIDACFDSEDYVEGRKAFGEKRAPKFAGR